MSDLPNSSYAVLGLLSFSRMSGYDLAAVAQRSVAHVWPVSKTQIYSELRRLHGLGLVDGRDAETSRGPARTLYELTPAGEAELDAWVLREGAAVAQLRIPVLLKVLFGHRVTRETTEQHLSHLEVQTEERLEAFGRLTSLLESNPDAVYAWACSLLGVRLSEALLAWISEVEQQLPPDALGIEPRRAAPEKTDRLLDILRSES